MMRRGAGGATGGGSMTEVLASCESALTSAKSFSVGPLHDHAATMRGYISEMRRRYISMWQLGLIAALLQAFLYLFAAHSLKHDFQNAAACSAWPCDSA